MTLSMSPLLDHETETVEAVDVPWVVLLHNDPINTREYVTMIIRKVFDYTEGKAEQLMLEADSNGRTVVWTGEQEKGTAFVEALHNYVLNASLVKDS